VSEGPCILFGTYVDDLYSYFAGEIIGNVLEIEARRWRRPKRVDLKINESRIVEFKKKYSKFDWTGDIIIT
jgi:Protein similar to CwfJ C-terminus 2